LYKPLGSTAGAAPGGADGDLAISIATRMAANAGVGFRSSSKGNGRCRAPSGRFAQGCFDSFNQLCALVMPQVSATETFGSASIMPR
jgi:hypothetical protein